MEKKDRKKKWRENHREEERIRTKKWRKKFPEKARENVKKSILKNPEPSRKAKRNWNKNNKNKKHAEYLASKIQIPKGEMCELCKTSLAKERHHPNYNNPLEVMFLCVKCHKGVHFGN
jgi:hypothetical protein